MTKTVIPTEPAERVKICGKDNPDIVMAAAAYLLSNPATSEGKENADV